MKPWEFVITCQSDMGPFADCLEENELPVQARVVRKMIACGKFPVFVDYEDCDFSPRGMSRIFGWQWRIQSPEDVYMKLPSDMLPLGCLQFRKGTYISLTESIWDVAEDYNFMREQEKNELFHAIYVKEDRTIVSLSQWGRPGYVRRDNGEPLLSYSDLGPEFP